jgi:transcriptional regulator with XRE-family HTH domain
LREARFLEQTELARRAGVSNDAIHRIERGTIATPQVATLRKLSRALGCSPPWAILPHEGDGGHLTAVRSTCAIPLPEGDQALAQAQGPADVLTPWDRVLVGLDTGERGLLETWGQDASSAGIEAAVIAAWSFLDARTPDPAGVDLAALRRLVGSWLAATAASIPEALGDLERVIGRLLAQQDPAPALEAVGGRNGSRWWGR